MTELRLKKADEIKIFIDPYNNRIMRVIKDRHEPMTVKEIADTIGEVPAKVHYHVKKLEAIGVLFIKHTKEVNGIIAKYYDFTTDTVALSIDDKDEKSDLIKSQVVREYGVYYDEAKQKFYDLYNLQQNPEETDAEVFITIKDHFTLKAGQVTRFNEELSALIDKYVYKGEDSSDYNLFVSILPNLKKGKK